MKHILGPEFFRLFSDYIYLPLPPEHCKVGRWINRRLKCLSRQLLTASFLIFTLAHHLSTADHHGHPLFLPSYPHLTSCPPLLLIHFSPLHPIFLLLLFLIYFSSYSFSLTFSPPSLFFLLLFLVLSFSSSSSTFSPPPHLPLTPPHGRCLLQMRGCGLPSLVAIDLTLHN